MPGESSGPSDMRDLVETALQKAFMDSGEMITKWVLVAETMTEDGKPGIWTMTPNMQNIWDTHGMLRFAQIREDGCQMFNIFKEHEEGM